MDISFDTPDRTWGAGLTRPTLNVFLWQLGKSTTAQVTGLGERAVGSGRVERRPVSPVVEFGYILTAWATDQRDEHQLLGTALEWVLAHESLPVEAQPEALDGVRCGLSVADRELPTELWGAFEGRLKAAVPLVVSLPVDVFQWQPTGAPVESIEATTSIGQVRREGDEAPAQPPLRRRRAHGSLVMEGRPDQDAE